MVVEFVNLVFPALTLQEHRDFGEQQTLLWGLHRALTACPLMQGDRVKLPCLCTFRVSTARGTLFNRPKFLGAQKKNNSPPKVAQQPKRW